jgi:hypothetical protein
MAGKKPKVAKEANMSDEEKTALEKALKEVRFLDEPEGDEALLRLVPLPGCTKDCSGDHCGGKTGDCPKQRTCDGKCLQKGSCLQQSEKWCAHQNMECPSKSMCSPKCHMRGLPI